LCFLIDHFIIIKDKDDLIVGFVGFLVQSDKKFSKQKMIFLFYLSLDIKKQIAIIKATFFVNLERHGYFCRMGFVRKVTQLYKTVLFFKENPKSRAKNLHTLLNPK
jgi:hypothetical protein